MSAGDLKRNNVIGHVVDVLCRSKPYRVISFRDDHQMPMPSMEKIADVVKSLRSLLFPGYFGLSDVNHSSLPFYTGSILSRVFDMLSEQIKRGMYFSCQEQKTLPCESECEEKARVISSKFIESLPGIRTLLASDVRAAYEGDPAAKSLGETIFCYPSIRALTSYRIAHELYRLSVPLIPRIITEMAHSETGIDIHPGAEIKDRFFMDHGTGIVIGETCIIGRNVRLYQGVTLGAESFPLDEKGNPVKGIPRHPIVEDDVIIYSGATILGRVTIGKSSVIGGNVWLTHSVRPYSHIVQASYEDETFEDGAGI